MIAYLKKKFFQPDDATWKAGRREEAQSMATDHARLAVEADEAAEWAKLQAEHHRNLAKMYSERLACQTAK